MRQDDKARNEEEERTVFRWKRETREYGEIKVEKETRLPRGTLTCARSPPARHRGALYSGASIFEYLVHTCIRQRREARVWRGVEGGRGGERRNSAHSEAFGREVCSACTLHSRAVHNSYCPSTGRMRAAHTTSSRLSPRRASPPPP